MNEDHDPNQSSLMNTSISSNKRSNFQFTYDSETSLLLLIHKYKEDIFTRGNIIKTWEKVLQEFNEQHTANIVQSRTINHRFQILKKNLENRLKHENQPLVQLTLNENEKLLIDIIDYMYKNNYTDVNPYSLGGGVISSSEHTDHVGSSEMSNQQPEHHLSSGDITQISPNTFTTKLNQERAQYLMSHEFDHTVHQFQSGIGMSHPLQQQQQQPQQPQQPQHPTLQQQSTTSSSSDHLQQHQHHQQIQQPQAQQQLDLQKDTVTGFPPPLAQSELIDESNRLPQQTESILQSQTSSQSSPQVIYKSEVNISSTTLPQDQMGSHSDPAHSSRHLMTPQLQPDQQRQRPPQPSEPIEHRSRQQSATQLSPTIHFEPTTQQLHQQEQQQGTINYTYTQQPHQQHFSQSHSTESQEPSVTLLLQQLLVSQNQVNLSINALRDDLRNFKVQTDQKINDLIHVQQLQQNNGVYQKLDTLIDMLRARSLKSNSSSSGDDDMTQEDHTGNSHEQTTSSE